ncbi:Gp37-like protein [Rhodococcus sp. NPDC055112]
MPPLMSCDEVRATITQRTIDRVAIMRSRPKLTLYDKNWENPVPLVGEIQASFEEKLNDTGEGNLTLFGNHATREWLIEELDDEEDVHIRVEMHGKEWTGKASTITNRGDERGFEFIEIKFLHEYEHVKKIICYSNPLLPAELQYPKLWAFAGPSIFGIKTLMFLNLMRRFGPLWALPENIFDPASWAGNLNPANWPIVVMPGKFLTDTSMWSVLSTRFGNLHDVIAPTLSDAGLQVVVKRWFPGMPQPAPQHFILTKTTLVIDVVDKSGYRGLTGTVLDGLMHLVTNIADDLINEVVTELTNVPNPEEYSLSGFLGTKPSHPFVTWRNAQRTGLTGIGAWQATVHKALAGAIVTGGHSPDWVNAGLKLIANAILGYIGAMFGNAGLALGIFDSQIEDVVLAFHRVPNPIRQHKMGIRGPGYGEYWESTGGTGFSLSALQAIRTGFDRTKAYRSYKISVRNGAPWWVGRHFDLGDRTAVEVGKRGSYYIDHVYALKVSWDRQHDPRFDISIGNDGAEDMPGAMLARQVAQVKSIIQAIGVSS